MVLFALPSAGAVAAFPFADFLCLLFSFSASDLAAFFAFAFPWAAFMTMIWPLIRVKGEGGGDALVDLVLDIVK